MSLKSTFQPTFAALLTSNARRDARRWFHEQRRRLRGEAHRLTAYLRLDDPYALVLLHGLQTLRERFEVAIDVRVVGATPDAMNPAPEALRSWARLDAARLAALYDYPTPPFVDARATRADAAAVSALETTEDPLPAIRDAFEQWWRGVDFRGRGDAARVDANDRERAARGHYLSAMVHYGGEWYWGVDRLNHLEQRLRGLGIARGSAEPAFERRFAFLEGPRPTDPPPGELELFWSARSPYAYLALARTFALADHYRVPLRIRPVLPMVMRNLSVPAGKRFYILHDAKREADWIGVPLGRVCDPVGAGVERCYALLEVAREHDRLREFVLAFATMVWSEGVDAASDAGLARITERAGLPWDQCARALPEKGWRDEVEANRQALLDAGHWGVPVIRYGDTTVWGQDRFWVLERALRGA
ncbi:MAG: DsbA family protein [Nannocystaceae bacterium]|nr:DsbA family protein [bacterium]